MKQYEFIPNMLGKSRFKRQLHKIDKLLIHKAEAKFQSFIKSEYQWNKSGNVHDFNDFNFINSLQKTQRTQGLQNTEIIVCSRIGDTNY